MCFCTQTISPLLGCATFKFLVDTYDNAQIMRYFQIPVDTLVDTYDNAQTMHYFQILVDTLVDTYDNALFSNSSRYI